MVLLSYDRHVAGPRRAVEDPDRYGQASAITGSEADRGIRAARRIAQGKYPTLPHTCKRQFVKAMICFELLACIVLAQWHACRDEMVRNQTVSGLVRQIVGMRWEAARLRKA